MDGLVNYYLMPICFQTSYENSKNSTFFGLLFYSKCAFMFKLKHSTKHKKESRFSILKLFSLFNFHNLLKCNELNVSLLRFHVCYTKLNAEINKYDCFTINRLNHLQKQPRAFKLSCD